MENYLICIAETGQPVRVGGKMVWANLWFAQRMCDAMNADEGAGTYAVYQVKPGGLSWLRVADASEVKL